MYEIYKDSFSYLIFLTLDPLFYFYGSCQMLFAIRGKKSRVAQEGLEKFKYSLIFSVISMGYAPRDLWTKELFLLLHLLSVVFSSVVCFVGGFAVVKVFKKNHPQARLDAYQVPEDEKNDFLKQNKVLVAEASKYEKKLDAWPYFFYFCLLKFAVVAEISFVFCFTLRYLFAIFQVSPGNQDAPIIAILMGFIASSLLNMSSCYLMEIAARTRNLEKAKRAVFLLKICTLLSIIKCFFASRFFSLDCQFAATFWFECSVLVPSLCLMGSLKAKKAIKQRDHLVRFSSYPENSYL